MPKKFKMVAAAVAVTGILVAVFAVPAFAATPQETDTDGQYYCPGHGSGYGAGISDSVAALLKLTPEQIQTQLQGGKSLAEIAATQGVSEDALVKAIIADMTAVMQQRVKDGVMTQAQVDQMLQYMQQRIREVIKFKATGAGSGPGGYGGLWGGMMGGWNKSGNTGTPGYGPGYGMMGGYGGGMMGGYGGGMMGRGWNR